MDANRNLKAWPLLSVRLMDGKWVKVLNLKGAIPEGITFENGAPSIVWRVGGQKIESGFDRFYPLELRAVPGFQKLRVVWGDFGDLPFTDPFFALTLKKAKESSTFAQKFETDLDVLSGLAEHSAAMPFGGSVFHMARTGSTLVSRLLSKSKVVHSLSEYTILDSALLRTEDWIEGDRIRLLHDVIRVVARPRRPSDRSLVMKMTDATANTRLPLFRAAFPNVPWIFIYRDPVEVMVSMITKPTGNVDLWMKNRVHAANFLKMPELADASLWPVDFIAKTLRGFCLEALKAAKATPPGLFLAVSYDRLPHAVYETIAPHFGIKLTDDQKAIMETEARFSAKEQDQVEFKSDRSTKMKKAPARVVDLARRYVEPILEQIRALPQG